MNITYPPGKILASGI